MAERSHCGTLEFHKDETPKESDGIKLDEFNRQMRNKAMERKIKAGKCIDLSKYERSAEGHYILPNGILEDMDYCNAETEEWIWSIGKNHAGQVLASHSAEFYQNDEIECLWLR